MARGQARNPADRVGALGGEGPRRIALLPESAGAESRTHPPRGRRLETRPAY